MRQVPLRWTPWGQQVSSGNPKSVPDILYHATTLERVEKIRKAGRIQAAGDRPVVLSADEGQAWREAHRNFGASPAVLVVDVARHRHRRLAVRRGRRPHLFVARQVPVRYILSLQENYALQLSAGGIPIKAGPDGQPMMALIQVRRRSGTTWEVAKGKLERGETPEWAAVREVREEMGTDTNFNVRSLVGVIRYGFMAPGNQPRLKSVHLYLLDPVGPFLEDFQPSEREGIGMVRWFTPDDAVSAVTHSSLKPLIRRARRTLIGR